MARWMIFGVCTLLLEVLPTLLSCGQRVISIAHWEKNHLLVFAGTVALDKGVSVGQSPQCPHHPFHSITLCHMKSFQMSAAFHQLEIVELGEVSASIEQWLDHRLLRVVNEHKDVRQLEGRLLPNSNARGESFRNRLLGGTNQALGALREAVHFQIQGNQQTLATGDNRSLPIQKDEAWMLWNQNTVSVVLVHFVPDTADDLLVCFCITQVHLRKYQVQRRRGVSDKLFDVLPVLRLGRVLVAGDNAPLGQVEAFPWQKHPGNLQADIWKPQCVRAPEHLVSAGADTYPCQAHGPTGQVQHIPQENGKGNLAHTPWHWRYLGHLLQGLLEANISNHALALLSIRDDVHANIDHHRTGLDPVASYQARTSSTGNQNIRLLDVLLQVGGLTVARRDSAVVGSEQCGDGRPHGAGAAQHHRMLGVEFYL
mmetsp:Transcript_22907/g.54066  ORF Transcript_22907/g.54066 Transcript_22907/m.54066 type:complete len:426 (-) Transcript_22907:614-1891(-)